MNYGMLEASAARLQLWIDHSIERRTKRAHGQVRGGSAEASEFAIQPSKVVMNHPDGDADVIGANRFLIHKRSHAVLQLTHEKLALLEARRSFRRSDRRHTDLEWDLYSFFEVILRTASSRFELGVLRCNFETMSGSEEIYSVSLDAESIEDRP
jgi:hypothetical protein